MTQPRPIPNDPLITLVLTLSTTDSLIDLLRQGVEKQNINIEYAIHLSVSDTLSAQERIEYIDELRIKRGNYQVMLKGLLDAYDGLHRQPRHHGEQRNPQIKL